MCGVSGEAALEVTRLVERALRDSRAVDLEALCVLAGQKVPVAFESGPWHAQHYNLAMSDHISPTGTALRSALWRACLGASAACATSAVHSGPQSHTPSTTLAAVH